MRLSTVFELLLIFLFLALASSRHIDKKRLRKGVTKQNLNPYCKCSDLQCNCCRDFPVVPIKGPGCASLGYQSGDALRLTMSYGDRILRNISLTGKRPKPVCMGLPGGISKFCGRLYNIQRVEDHFKACLSLELRALDELEAALRVSCFNFGPKGVKLEPGEPLPSVARPADEEDDDDDYDDIDDDDDDDDDEFDDDDDEYNDVDTDGDYTGFAALSDQIFEGFFFPTAESSGNKKKKPVRPVVQQEPVVEVTTKAASVVLNDTKEVSTTAVPSTSDPAATQPSTTQRAETTQGPSKLVTMTTPKSLPESSEKIDSTELGTDEPSTESVTLEDEKTNETESESEEEAAEILNNEKEQPSSDDLLEREEEESNEGSAEEELDDVETEEAAQAKVEDDDDDDDDDDDEDDDDSDEDHESAEHEAEHDEKDEDNILNVFFNHDDDSNETERERTRMEREKFKKILPGLMALLQPSPTPPTDDLSASFAYPAVRSARVHRRMRLPPV